jgi:hypothetical protein
MIQQESYIQYLAGYSKDAVNIQDVKTALADLHGMDDEHGAFWVSVIKNEENVLEAHKDLSVVGVFEDDQNKQYVKQCADFEDIEQLYSLLLNEDFVELKKRLEAS